MIKDALVLLAIVILFTPVTTQASEFPVSWSA